MLFSLPLLSLFILSFSELFSSFFHFYFYFFAFRSLFSFYQYSFSFSICFYFSFFRVCARPLCLCLLSLHSLKCSHQVLVKKFHLFFFLIVPLLPFFPFSCLFFSKQFLFGFRHWLPYFSLFSLLIVHCFCFLKLVILFVFLNWLSFVFLIPFLVILSLFVPFIGYLFPTFPLLVRCFVCPPVCLSRTLWSRTIFALRSAGRETTEPGGGAGRPYTGPDPETLHTRHNQRPGILRRRVRMGGRVRAHCPTRMQIDVAFCQPGVKKIRLGGRLLLAGVGVAKLLVVPRGC